MESQYRANNSGDFEDTWADVCVTALQLMKSPQAYKEWIFNVSPKILHHIVRWKTTIKKFSLPYPMPQ